MGITYTVKDLERINKIGMWGMVLMMFASMGAVILNDGLITPLCITAYVLVAMITLMASYKLLWASEKEYERVKAEIFKRIKKGDD